MYKGDIYMKKTLKVVTALTVLGFATQQATALAVDYSDASVTGWVQRTVEHVRNSVTNSQYYVVQWGDTLWTISQALDVPTESLVGLNGIANPDLIIAGSVIYYNPSANTVTLDDRQGNVETVQADTHQQVAAEAVPQEVLSEASQQPVDLSPVTQVHQAPTASAAAFQEAQAAAQAQAQAQPVAEPASAQEQASQSSESQVQAASEVNAPVSVEESSSPVAESTAPVAESPAPVEEAPATPAAPAVEESSEQAAPAAEESKTEETSNSSSSGYQGIQSAAKEWIAQKESGGDYNAVNPSGRYIGRYQLTAEYLNGDYSIENQERVADEYVKNRYGSWEAAKVFWEANGWY